MRGEFFYVAIPAWVYRDTHLPFSVGELAAKGISIYGCRVRALGPARRSVTYAVVRNYSSETVNAIIERLRSLLDGPDAVTWTDL